MLPVIGIPDLCLDHGKALRPGIRAVRGCLPVFEAFPDRADHRHIDVLCGNAEVFDDPFVPEILLEIAEALLVADVEIPVEIFVVRRPHVLDLCVLIDDDPAVEDLRVVGEFQAFRLVDTVEVENILEAGFVQGETVEIAVQAVIVERLVAEFRLKVEELSLGRAAVHLRAVPALLFIEVHGEVCGFFVQGMGEIVPAAPDAVVNALLPERVHIVR